MKICCISDTHHAHRKTIIPEGDVLIHAGDGVGPTMRGLEEFLNWFVTHPHPVKIFIGGNTDSVLEQQPVAVRSLIPSSVVYLENEGINVNGVRFWGSPIVPRFLDISFNADRGSAIKKYWDLIPEETDVLITHSPPMGILDKTARGASVGCLELLNRVQEIQPKLHFFGHVHESYGKYISNGTQFYNAAYMNRGNAPWCVEFNN